MNFSIFSESYILQAIGWGVANSLWQGLVLWLILRIYNYFNQKSTAVYRYYVGMILLFSTFLSFFASILQGYYAAKGSQFQGTIALSEHNFQIVQQGSFWISVMYVFFLTFYIVRFFTTLYYTRKLAKNHLAKPGIDIRLFTSHSSTLLGITKKVHVWVSDNVSVPTVLGYIKPMILLPIAAINNLNTKQLESVLLHELVHIKRNDYLTNLLQTLIETILFFNPFVHLISDRIRQERENCCDDWVINFCFDKNEYAKALFILEEHRQTSLEMTLSATNGKKVLLKRIKRLFFLQNAQSYVSAFQKIKIGLFSALLLFSIAIVSQDQILQRNNMVELPQDFLPIHNAITTSFQDILPGIAENSEKKSYKQVKKDNNSGIKRHQEDHIIPNPPKTFAFINEELLNPEKSRLALIEPPGFQLVSDNDQPDKKTAFVKIEEEQSGNDHNKVYIFRLDKNGEKSSITPLILLNEQRSDSGHSTKPDTLLLRQNRKITL